MRSPSDRRRAVTLAAILVALIVSGAATGAARQPSGGRGPLPPRIGARVDRSRLYARLPLSFVPNAGQFASPVRFEAQGAGEDVVLTRDSVGVAIGPAHMRAAALQMRLVGAHPAAVSGLQRLPGRVNYLIGSHPRRWRADLPGFARALYRQAWPGIHVVLHGSRKRLEYDFVLAPHADATMIRLRFSGASAPRIDGDGALSLTLASRRRVWMLAPVAYQGGAGGATRRRVDAHFEALRDGTFGVALGPYDHARALLIDPSLAYSTYLGGPHFDEATAIALDGSGDAYVTGETSGGFPLQNAEQPTFGGSTDAFVSELNPAGNALLYSTYLGGSGDDAGHGIALDASGNAYVTGTTISTDFPTKNAVQTTPGGAFAAELGPSGNLVYSTYLGSPSDGGSAIAVGPSGEAFVAGFGTGATANGFITALSASDSATVYSIRLGGSGNDNRPAGIATDGLGNAYVTGATQGAHFPTVNPIQPSYGGGNFDAFVTKLDPSGGLVYSTFLGGNDIDQGRAIALDGAGNAYVTGQTQSTNFPLVNPVQATKGGSAVTFLTKVNAAGTALVYSTYLGGDSGFGVAVDRNGNAYVTGVSSATPVPTTPNAEQPSNAGGADAFLTELDASGTAIVHSTYLGGSGNDAGFGVAVDGLGDAFVAGDTSSSDFPTAGPEQARLGGGFDAFVTKSGVPQLLVNGAAAPPQGGSVAAASPSPGASCAGSSCTVNPGGAVTLTVAPNAGFTFSGWIGACAGQGNPCTLIDVNVDESSTATLASAGAPAVTALPATSVGVSSTTLHASVNPEGQDAHYRLELASSPGAESIAPATATDPDAGTSTAPQAVTRAVSGLIPGTTYYYVVVATNAEGTTVSNELSFRTTTPAHVTLTPPSPAFAGIGAEQTVTVTNDGGLPAHLSAVQITGTQASAFRLAADSCTGAALAPGAVCTMVIAFEPVGIGDYAATLLIDDDAAGSPQSIALTGTYRPVATLSTQTLEFGPGDSTPRTLIVSNTGDAPLTFGQARIDGSNASAFSISRRLLLRSHGRADRRLRAHDCAASVGRLDRQRHARGD